MMMVCIFISGSVISAECLLPLVLLVVSQCALGLHLGSSYELDHIVWSKHHGSELLS